MFVLFLWPHENGKNTFEMFLGELYAFQQAVASISRRYFDGHEVLFPDPATELAVRYL